MEREETGAMIYRAEDDQENQWTSSWNSYKVAIITISYHRMGVVDKSRAEERVSEHLRVKY